MGTDERPPAGALIGRLTSRPQGFNLFQAISLLERAAPDMAPVGEGNGQTEAVRLSAVVSLGFQASDVAGIAEGSKSGEPYTLSSPVMSLAGAQGPLPLPFTELLLERKSQRDHATADFLDIFNHRFLSFLYRSRKKHHMGLAWKSPQASSLASSLDSLSALGLKSHVQGPRGEVAWLRHAGLLGGAPRSMTGLLALLSDRLGVTVRGSQFRGGWRALEAGEVSYLDSRGGRGAPRLGDNAVLGKRIWYQSAGVRIEFDGLVLPRLRRLLPRGGEHELVKWMIRRYVQQEMGVELVLCPAAHRLERTRLTWPTAAPTRKPPVPLQLGWTSWLLTRPEGRTVLPPARVTLTDDNPGAHHSKGTTQHGH